MKLARSTNSHDDFVEQEILAILITIEAVLRSRANGDRKEHDPVLSVSRTVS